MPENKENIETVTKRHKGVAHKINWDLASCYRSRCLQTLGGSDWMHVLCAIGTLDDDIMGCMNEACVSGGLGRWGCWVGGGQMAGRW